MAPDEFLSWRDSRATQEVYRYLERRRTDNVNLAMGVLNNMAERNDAAPTRALWLAGVNAGLNELLELEHSQLVAKED